MNDLNDLLLELECDEFISSALMYQKVSYVEDAFVVNRDGTCTQHYVDIVEPIKVASNADAHIYRALRNIEKHFNTKL